MDCYAFKVILEILMKYSFLLIITAFCLSCQPEKESASDIINKSISYHGGTAYDTALIKFEFRDKYYFLQHNNGLYTYKRLFSDSLGNKIVDALNLCSLLEEFDFGLVLDFGYLVDHLTYLIKDSIS